MRAISLGVIAAGLAAILVSSASAGFSGRSGGGAGFIPFPVAHPGFGFSGRRLNGVPAAFRFDRDSKFRNVWFARDWRDRGRWARWGGWNYLGNFGSTFISTDSQPTEAAPNLPNVQIIMAPTYVPPAPVAKASASGPRIIVIGAQPKETLPVVVYGAAPNRVD
jgi:hypothetical protein